MGSLSEGKNVAVVQHRSTGTSPSAARHGSGQRDAHEALVKGRKWRSSGIDYMNHFDSRARPQARSRHARSPILRALARRPNATHFYSVYASIDPAKPAVRLKSREPFFRFCVVYKQAIRRGGTP